MDDDDARRVLQAARALLRWDAAQFAIGVGVGPVTLRRIEAGVAVRADTLAVVLAGLEQIGIRVLENEAGITLGVGLLPHARIGPPPFASAHARDTSRQRAPRRPAVDKKRRGEGEVGDG